MQHQRAQGVGKANLALYFILLKGHAVGNGLRHKKKVEHRTGRSEQSSEQYGEIPTAEHQKHGVHNCTEHD